MEYGYTRVIDTKVKAVSENIDIINSVFEQLSNGVLKESEENSYQCYPGEKSGHIVLYVNALSSQFFGQKRVWNKFHAMPDEKVLRFVSRKLKSLALMIIDEESKKKNIDLDTTQLESRFDRCSRNKTVFKYVPRNQGDGKEEITINTVAQVYKRIRKTAKEMSSAKSTEQ